MYHRPSVRGSTSPPLSGRPLVITPYRYLLFYYSTLIPIMERNISLNKLQSNVTAAELDWCVVSCPLGCQANHMSQLGCKFLHCVSYRRAKPVPELQRPDLILAADCVYFEPAFPLLVSTLTALVPPPPERAPEVLFCYKKRRKADKRFFALLKKYFTWCIVRDREPKKKLYDTCTLKILRARLVTTLLRRNIAGKRSLCSACIADHKRDGFTLLISCCTRIVNRQHKLDR
jgi:hypothetical protein